jgi:anti-sigma factor RsiW
MTCDQLRQSVQALLDGDHSPEQQRALEAHAATCAACRTLIADLEAIRATAVVLERRKPSNDVWARIALQVTREPAFQKAAQQRLAQPVLPPTRWNWPVLAMAATLLIALIGGSLWILDRSRAIPGSSAGSSTGTGAGNASGNATTGALVETIEHELDQAAAHYEKAIAGLEQIANASDSPLDPEQMATVKQNLGVIDRAIDESRTALKAAPASQLAQESLFEAFRRKVSLLQDTIALMNEMRKGNQAGAARIAEGQNKS